MQTSRYDDTAIDCLIWQTIRDSECPDDFRNYLDHRLGNAAHLEEALDRLVELDDADTADNEGQRCYPAAVAAIEAMANAGNATAQFHMGKVLDKGIGVPVDIARSVAWYRLAILQGELRSHINLAGTLTTGDATPADYAEARQLYEKAAELGEPMGLLLLGRLAANGLGEKEARPDHFRALELFHAAWEQGDSTSGHWIGHNLLAGNRMRHDEALGREWIVKSAEAGCIGAILRLGRDAESGRGGDVDTVAALAWYRRGAQMGDLECHAWLGRLLLIGAGVAKDGAQAVYWLKRAAVRGYTYAQTLLGLTYLWGGNVVKNARFGRKWLERAAEAGDVNACYQFGRLFQEGEDKNLTEAARWFEKAARLGSSEAQAALGFCYWMGRGVAVEPHAAYKWIHLSSLQGDSGGMYLLGRLYQDGFGVDADYAAAARHFMRSATRGNAPAQARLGRCYLRGEGVDKDVAEGMVWLQRAIEQGHAEASTTVGRVLRDGIGVTANVAEASEWFLDAAEKGDAAGQRELALLYAEGHGLRQNLDEAQQWMEKAAAQGDKEALAWLARTETISKIAVSPAPTFCGA